MTQRHASRNSDALQTSLERLSSGLRINRAGDDAAGLAISGRMTTQIRGMSMAIRNANDAISMVQTAEGALATLTSSVQRIRELALQAANAPLSVNDKQSLQDEVNQLLQEMERVAQTTTFNSQKVFDTTGNGGLVNDTDKTAVVDGLRDRWLIASEERIAEYYGLRGDGASLEIILDDTPDPKYAAYVSGTANATTGRIENQELHIDMADFVPPNPPDGGTAPFYNDRIIAHEMVHAVMGRTTSMAGLPTWFLEGSAEFIHGADERVATDLALAGGGASGADTLVAEIGGAWSGSSAQYSSAYVATRYLHEAIKSEGGNGIRDVMDYLSANIGSSLDDALANVASSGQFATEAAFLADFTAGGGAGSLYLQGLDSGGQLSNEDTGAIGGLDADAGEILTASSVIDDTGRYSLDPLAGFAEVWESGYDVAYTSGSSGTTGFQVGAAADQTIDIAKVSMSLNALGLGDVNLLESTGKAITRADAALEYIDSARAELGAVLARMESAVKSNAITIENVAAARSRVLDADYARETADLVRANILQEAAVAMVTQANAAPGNVLQLLA